MKIKYGEKKEDFPMKMTNSDKCLTLALTLLVKYKIADIDSLTQSIKHEELFEHLESLYAHWMNEIKE